MIVKIYLFKPLWNNKTVFIIPFTKSNTDEIIIVIKTSGTKAFASHSGVANNIGTSNNIKIGKSKWNNIRSNNDVVFFLYFIFFEYLGSKHNDIIDVVNKINIIKLIHQFGHKLLVYYK